MTCCVTLGYAGVTVADIIVFEGRNYSRTLLKEWAESFGLALHPCLLCLFWPCASPALTAHIPTQTLP